MGRGLSPSLGVVMSRRLPRLAILALLLGGAGCALLAKKTPTPAAHLDPEVLARTPQPPNERYYLLLFGSQDQSRRPKYTHTWATIVRAISRPGATEPVLDEHTISWLPAKMDITPLNLRVEPGRNVGLHETICNSL